MLNTLTQVFSFRKKTNLRMGLALKLKLSNFAYLISTFHCGKVERNLWHSYAYHNYLKLPESYRKWLLTHCWQGSKRSCLSAISKYSLDNNWADNILDLRRKYNLLLKDENISNMSKFIWKSTVKRQILYIMLLTACWRAVTVTEKQLCWGITNLNQAFSASNPIVWKAITD